MAAPRAFISFDFDHDEELRNLFAGQSKNSRTPFKVQDWSSREDLPASEWQERIRARIAVCDMVIVLVGRATAIASGVAIEIAMADAEGVPVFGVYVDEADTATPLPLGLERHRVIDWEWDSIAQAIEQVMTEGKHGSDHA